VGGDGRSVSIAAASIIAKVTRDRLMVALHDRHPGYNWRSNKGYGTPEHYVGLKAHGVTVHHRRSFAPIHNLLTGHNILCGDESVDSNINALIQQDS
jgi:ribonuclease HII